ncbi:MAG: cytochrome P450 [Chloroflexi bacterium]|nr:MAG: cytochrome P450 [Chloroflexota bacterium]
MTTLSIFELQQKYAICQLGYDPFSWYKQMRMANPISVDEQEQLYELFRYKDVQAVLADPVRFSSKGLLGGEEKEERGSILVVDPPRHKKLRTLVSQAFTPRAIAQQADNIRGIVNELLDASTTSGTLDVIKDVAAPLPIRVIAAMLGVPLERQADFKRWAEGIASTSPEQAVASFRAFDEYTRVLLAQKRMARETDVVSALLDAEIDGEPLSEQEIVSFCGALLGAGLETTEHLIGNTILCLDEHPSARAMLWADPSLVSGTIEEALRFRPVVHRVARTVTKDTKIGGQSLKAGHRIFCWIGSANHDEEQWGDPEVFDIRRSPNQHLSFGSGIHFCLAAPLARLEVKILLEQIIERFKDIQRIYEVPLQFVPSFGLYGVQQLPVRVQKR